jgi:hypothetical protein
MEKKSKNIQNLVDNSTSMWYTKKDIKTEDRR